MLVSAAAELSALVSGAADSIGAAAALESALVVLAEAVDSVVVAELLAAAVVSSFLAQAEARAMAPATRTIRATGLIFAISNISFTLLNG
ncbi:hypothetical protein B1757_12480 [Acidithiobacillus marinus]|uniref:Uncharacterized protein n=1 Tax=Acidithiobacillus marinus TaxID=187490 RepID=A0A2I1DJ22_9PROT|nr:hypothetical protein B1757_12480 [Acidithiobacillus marinus]